MKIKFIAAYDSRGVSYHNFAKLIHQRFGIPGIVRDKIRQSTHIQDIWKRKVDLEFTTETLPPLWAVPRKLNRPCNYFVNLKLERFPIAVISHLVDKELPYKSYFNDVIVSLLFTVKCKGNYRGCLFATYMNYKW